MRHKVFNLFKIFVRGGRNPTMARFSTHVSGVGTFAGEQQMTSKLGAQGKRSAFNSLKRTEALNGVESARVKATWPQVGAESRAGSVFRCIPS